MVGEATLGSGWGPVAPAVFKTVCGVQAPGGFDSLPLPPTGKAVKTLARLALWLALSAVVWGETPPLVLPHTFARDGCEIEVRNVEVGRDNAHFLVHSLVRNRGREVAEVDWRRLFLLHLADGRTMTTNYDALVDRGGGLTRTTGPFPVEPGRRYQLTVPFLLYPEDFPVRLEIEGQGVGPPVRARR